MGKFERRITLAPDLQRANKTVWLDKRIMRQLIEATTSE